MVEQRGFDHHEDDQTVDVCGLELALILEQQPADTDRDGLTDSNELFVTFTDPLRDDTDSDGVLDGADAALVARAFRMRRRSLRSR